MTENGRREIGNCAAKHIAAKGIKEMAHWLAKRERREIRTCFAEGKALGR